MENGDEKKPKWKNIVRTVLLVIIFVLLIFVVVGFLSRVY